MHGGGRETAAEGGGSCSGWEKMVNEKGLGAEGVPVTPHAHPHRPGALGLVQSHPFPGGDADEGPGSALALWHLHMEGQELDRCGVVGRGAQVAWRGLGGPHPSWAEASEVPLGRCLGH